MEIQRKAKTLVAANPPDLPVVGVGVLVTAEAEAEVAVARPTWAEAQAMRKRSSLISQKITDLCMMIKDAKLFSRLSEAEREAKQGKLAEERSALLREYVRLGAEMSNPDFSGMLEADRAAEAERLRQEFLDEARRLQKVGDPEGFSREASAPFLDFDPKQRGRYFNRLVFVDLPTFDHDEECKSFLHSAVYFIFVPSSSGSIYDKILMLSAGSIHDNFFMLMCLRLPHVS